MEKVGLPYPLLLHVVKVRVIRNVFHVRGGVENIGPTFWHCLLLNLEHVIKKAFIGGDVWRRYALFTGIAVY